MGPVLLFVCLPQIMDVKTYGTFDKAPPLILHADGSSKPPGVQGAFYAPKPKIRFSFRMKIAEGAGQLSFTLEEGSGNNWNLIGGSSSTERLPIPQNQIDVSRTEITIGSTRVPSIAVECRLKKEVPSQKSAVESDAAPKVVPPADATGASAPGAPAPQPAGTRDAN